jgi:hypothetical protein
MNDFLVQEKNWEMIEEWWDRKKKLNIAESSNCNFFYSTSEESLEYSLEELELEPFETA